MYLEKLIYKKVWIVGIVLFICSCFTLNSFYFISRVNQNIYYGIHFAFSIILIVIIRNNRSLNINNWFLILFNLIIIYVIYIIYSNHFIAVPLFLIFPSLLVFPLLHSDKSYGILKILSRLSHVLLLVVMTYALVASLIFTSVVLIKKVDSPTNNNQIIEVYSLNNGAMGGSTHVYLTEKYCYIFKKNRHIYTGHYGEGNDIVKWIDNNHIQIDSKTIDIKKNY